MFGFDFSQSFNNVLNQFVQWIPNIVEFIVVIILGYFVALIAGWIVKKVLHLAKLDYYLERGVVGDWVTGAVGRPSKFIGKIGFWVVWFGSVGVAASLANLPLVGNLVSTVYNYLPNVLSALFIFVAAAIISAVVNNIVKRVMGDTPTGKILSSIVPVLVMSISGFAILNALKISPQIVQITYAALMGSLALGLALAFGLGGREVASRILDDAYKSGQKQSRQVKKDFQKGSEQGKKEFKKFQDSKKS
ncbi:MAG: mechanosensitive ion channel family protein [Candidatus Saccharimonadales bacterium]